MPDLAGIFRREAGRCTATLIRVLGDIDLAEDAAAEAFAIAAERWPTQGVPPNPGGWITTTARNRAIDRLRRESTRTDHHLAARRLETDDMEPDHNPELDALDGFVDVVADDQLRLMFLCCHPALAADAQVALTLRLLGGLDTPEIARAFRPRTDPRPADRPRQAQATRQPRLLPRALRRGAARPPPRRPDSDLPDLHRRAHRDHWRGPHPRRPLA
jgi:predicted RNA polymerase sigma factor